jgi:acyl-CoA synthetase (AMP-forming)/AMP-acid ligase II
MAGLIEDSIRRTAGQVAIGMADGSLRLSYRQLGELARVLAGQLAQAGITHADPIALYSDNQPEFVVALLAAWTAGAAVVPIDPQLAPAEVRARLAAVSAKAVVVPHRLRDSYPAHAGATPAWSVDIDAASNYVALAGINHDPSQREPLAPNRRARPVRHPDLALLMFTTGSTGTPKIVPLTHANLAASVAGIRSTYHLGPDDATLLAMPLFHGHGLIAGLLATLASGGAAYLPAAGRFSAHRFWDEITAAQATWYTAVPTVHQILLARAATDYPAAHPPVLRFIRSSSASLAPAVLHETEDQFGAPVIPAYGMTETAHQAASNPLPDDGPRKDASVGLPTGLQVRILASSGNLAAAGETGEVCVRGPALADGYLDDPQATAVAFTGGWFRTGDLGYTDPDGYLFLTGRTKDMINRGGEKIAPQAVEAALLSHPAVQDALAFAAADAKYGEDINAAVILMPGQQATQADLQEHCRARLAGFEIPTKIYFLNRFPRTSKGDGDRRALAAALTRQGSPR